MAFDLRVGLYDDPPNQDIIKIIQATFDGFKYLGYLNRGWESQLYRFVTTPSYRKFCETQDTLFSIGQKIVDRKVADLKKLTADGDEFVENQGRLSSKVSYDNIFFSFLSFAHCFWEVLEWNNVWCRLVQVCPFLLTCY